MKPWRLYAPFVSDCTKGLRYAKVYKKGDNKSFYTIVLHCVHLDVPLHDKLHQQIACWRNSWLTD